MAGKQITELSSTSSFNEGDLMLVRKSGAGVDRKINYTDFVESIGNSAIDGYVAVAEQGQQNKIVLTTANGAPLNKYYVGMKISFVSPIASNGVVEIKIGTLNYVALERYNEDSTVVLQQNDYIEAVYINNKFKQVNNLNTNQVWSNEYTATGAISGDETTTTLTLSSAIGIKKSAYYTGMSLLFKIPLDTKGSVRVNVDALGLKDLNDGPDDKIANDLYKNQTILAIYDGTQFIKNKFNISNQSPIIEEIPPLIDVTIPPIIDWQPGYVGDPNNILAATSPDYTNSDGIKFFKKTVTVGNDANYASLRDAIEALKNEFGPDGGGKKYAINILNGFNQAKMNQTHIVGDDLSWISIFSVNNYEVIFDTGGNQNLTGAFVLHCRVAPIFNFKFQRNGQILPPNTNCIFYLADDAPDTVTIMLGSNTEINFQSMQYYPQGNPFNYPSSVFGSSGYKSLNLQAQNGFKLYSPHFLLAYIVGFKCFINNATFHHTGNDRYIFGAYAGLAVDYDITMYNSTFFFNNKQAGEKELSYGGIYLASNKQNNTPCLFQNVTNTQRTHTMVGIRTQNQNITLDHCNFSGGGQGGDDSGYDIYVFGETKDNKIYLKNNTTGKTNQIKNIETNKGLIKEII